MSLAEMPAGAYLHTLWCGGGGEKLPATRPYCRAFLININ